VLSNPPEYLAKTRQAIKDLNTFVGKIVGPIANVIATQAKEAPADKDARIYGPHDQGNVTLLLTVKRKTAVRYGWKLDAKPLGGADSAYKTVAVGELQKIERAHRGRGFVGLDLDAFASVDSTSKATGKLLAAFAHTAGGAKVLAYRLKNFTPDSTQHAAVNGALYGHKTPSGEAVVRFAGLTDAISGPNGDELMIGRLHWIPGTGGRADLLLPNKGVNGTPPNGDVPADKYIVAASCWDKSEQEGFKASFQCNVGQGPSGCTVISTEGSRTACKPGVDQDATVSDSDASRTNAEPDAPAQLDGDAPVEMPTFG
jgi:hypothetical protein